MSEDSLQASFDFFGLSDDASIDEVEKSFRELRNLYSEGSLATYSLLDDTDRQEKLAALRKAYDRILQSYSHTTDSAVDPERGAGPFPAEVLKVNIDADLQQMPGLFLQQSRKALGLSLQDVATRTKVRASILQDIEEQRFDFLPAPVYLRGFLREFARMVNVPDADALIDAFMARYKNDKERQTD